MPIKTMDSQKRIIKAAKDGDIATLRTLLEADSSLVSATDTDGSTPLHYAAWKGHEEVAQALLESGADVHAKNTNSHWGDTPLHAAAHGNRRAVAELLIAHGADIQAKDPDGHTPLHETFAHQATAVANLLKKHGAIE